MNVDTSDQVAETNEAERSTGDDIEMGCAETSSPELIRSKYLHTSLDPDALPEDLNQAYDAFSRVPEAVWESRLKSTDTVSYWTPMVPITDRLISRV
jgi:hypothetical protein